LHVKLRLPSIEKWALLLMLALCSAGAYAVPVSHVQVRIVTGAADLAAGSYLELRIYEAGKAVQRVALTHGEAWPRDSTRVIPLTLNGAIDPRNVQRFSLYYRAANPLSPPLEVVSADVDLSAGREPQQLLLDTTLSGEIAQQGELATLDRDARSMTCMSDADCDDQKACNGVERCAPHTPGADARGCVAGRPMVCPVNEICAEGRGCVGAGAPKASASSK
jgi:hypothetical protein